MLAEDFEQLRGLLLATEEVQAVVREERTQADVRVGAQICPRSCFVPGGGREQGVDRARVAIVDRGELEPRLRDFHAVGSLHRLCGVSGDENRGLRDFTADFTMATVRLFTHASSALPATMM